MVAVVPLGSSFFHRSRNRGRGGFGKRCFECSQFGCSHPEKGKGGGEGGGRGGEGWGKRVSVGCGSDLL